MNENLIFANDKPVFQGLLTASEVARILGLGTSTIYQLIRQGALASVRFGRAVRVLPDDLQAFIEANRVNTSSL